MTQRGTDRVVIYDSTLREGEQAPDVCLLPEQKLKVARQLAAIGVDVIEAGFPMTSPGELSAVRAVAGGLRGPRPPVVTALARANRVDIARAHKALEMASRPRVNIFVQVSERQLGAHGMSAREASERARTAVCFGRSLFEDVQFSLGDAMRAEPGYLAEVVRGVIDGGAGTVTLVDTVGAATPDEMTALIGSVYERVPELAHVVLSVHCHDDRGLALANAYAGVLAGARQVECTINGLGDRAGNVALEEIVMLLHSKASTLGLSTGVVTTELLATSRLVADVTGYPVPRNKAVVGRNAFAHETGIHQDAVLRDPGSYQAMDSDSLGQVTDAQVLGKHTGLAGLRAALAAAGYPQTPRLLHSTFRRLKQLADTGGLPVDVHALVSGDDAGELSASSPQHDTPEGHNHLSRLDHTPTDPRTAG